MASTEVRLVREKTDGQLISLQEDVMCLELGIDKLPEGWTVVNINGDSLDCGGQNLALVPDRWAKWFTKRLHSGRRGRP